MFLETMKLGMSVLNQTQVLSFVFRLIFSALFFVAGFLLIFYLRYFLLKLFQILKIEYLSAKLRLNQLTLLSGLNKSFPEVLLNIFYWLGLTVFFILALGLMHGNQVVERIVSLISYYLKDFSINVFVSVFIIVFGILLAQFIGYIVKMLLNLFNIPFAKFVVIFAKAIILINALLQALFNVGLITSWSLAIDVIGIAFVVLLTFTFLLAINNQFLKLTLKENLKPAVTQTTTKATVVKAKTAPKAKKKTATPRKTTKK